MPKYKMKCTECGLVQFVLGSMDNPPVKTTCSSCGSLSAERYYHRTRVYVDIFQPYVTEHLTGDPICIRSREDRDRIYKQYKVILDRDSSPRPPDTPLLDPQDYATIVGKAHELSAEEVKAQLKRPPEVDITEDGSIATGDFDGE